MTEQPQRTGKPTFKPIQFLPATPEPTPKEDTQPPAQPTPAPTTPQTKRNNEHVTDTPHKRQKPGDRTLPPHLMDELTEHPKIGYQEQQPPRFPPEPPQQPSHEPPDGWPNGTIPDWIKPPPIPTYQDPAKGKSGNWTADQVPSWLKPFTDHVPMDLIMQMDEPNNHGHQITTKPSDYDIPDHPFILVLYAGKDDNTSLASTVHDTAP